MVCSYAIDKYKSILCVLILFVAFSSISYANTNVNNKEEIAKRQIASEFFNRYQYTAKALNISQPNNPERDASKIIVSSNVSSFKIRYLPTPVLDINLDYNKKTKKITAISLKTRALDTLEKIESYKNNLYILSKMIDPKINQYSFNDIYNNLDIPKASSEPKYLRGYINDGFFFEVDAYARRTQIFTLRIREKNKTDEDNLNLIKDIRGMYSNSLAKLNASSKRLIYPEFGLSSIKTKKAFFFSSENVSMELLLETKLRNLNAISGTIVFENPAKVPLKEEEFSRDALILLSLTDSRLSRASMSEILSTLNISQAVSDRNYHNSTTTQNKVYTIGHDKSKLFLSVDVRDADYDKKVKLEGLTKQLYNSSASNFDLLNKVKELESKSLSTSLSQNTVMFRVNPYLTFRVYFDSSLSSISRINIIMPKELLDKNSEVQKSNALIATKMMNPSINYSEAENIYNSLKGSYGATDTYIINNIRYKRCSYNDETLVFSKTDAQDSLLGNRSNLANSTTTAYNNNPNLVYEAEEETQADPKTSRAKPQPLCY